MFSFSGTPALFSSTFINKNKKPQLQFRLRVLNSCVTLSKSLLLSLIVLRPTLDAEESLKITQSKKTITIKRIPSRVNIKNEDSSKVSDLTDDNIVDEC